MTEMLSLSREASRNSDIKVKHPIVKVSWKRALGGFSASTNNHIGKVLDEDPWADSVERLPSSQMLPISGCSLCHFRVLQSQRPMLLLTVLVRLGATGPWGSNPPGLISICPVGWFGSG